MLDFEISGDSDLCHEIRARKFSHFGRLATYVQNLPYGRTSPSDDPAIVLFEQRGTCSSKHRLLAAIAHDCGHADIALTVGIYAMCEANTPGVGRVLLETGMEAVPEAHCYLTHDEKRYDFTGLDAGISSPFGALLEEHFVVPSDLIRVKRQLHQAAIDRWSRKQGVSPENVWSVREKCIPALLATTRPRS
jgi:hypothetical protein